MKAGSRNEPAVIDRLKGWEEIKFIADVGLLTTGEGEFFGVSPDGIIMYTDGSIGGLEIKSMQAATTIDAARRKRFELTGQQRSAQKNWIECQVGDEQWFQLVPAA
mgnify:CR=1 FL=1